MRTPFREDHGRAALAAAWANLLAWSARVVPIFPAKRSDRSMIRAVGWRGILVLFAVCSLTLSVATRYCTSSGSLGAVGHSVKTRLAEPKVQRLVLAKDNTQGLPPVRRLALVPIAACQSCIALDGPPVPIVDFEHAVSNRAPPLSTRLV